MSKEINTPFQNWWAKNHPFDWFASALHRGGKPMSYGDRFLVRGLVEAAFHAGRATATPKIYALKSGGDWSDASMVHVVLPEGVDIDGAHAEWREWYATECLPVRMDSPVYMDFGEFLLKRKGARWPTKEELVVFDEY